MTWFIVSNAKIHETGLYAVHKKNGNTSELKRKGKIFTEFNAPNLCVHLSVCLLRTVHARILKFHIWIPHGKIFDACFFLVRVSSLSGVMSL